MAACRQLYVDGLLGGKLAENDSGLDIDDIDHAYMRTDGNHFWVAETNATAHANPGHVHGNIGVQHIDNGTPEVRRLRVRGDMRRRGIGSKLVESAVFFCLERGFLMITLVSFSDREPAINLFQKFHFRHDKTRTVAGKDLMYFYLDLYSGERKANASS